ncbi:hypothetical protein K3G63_11095 [Hymenobacter sp. HSC-4F20]|uniref:hypothetical protein n=1 Tax=Hymenobacter sp. HSC-4F20 TaxID=2864135 RepID=UPI001C72E0D0|nr:hypothetical protein [Hymenobacter sp. HSC-4F20]MBX0290989.1 hypothetical protein [Hymenobacter sp. HSC-4F20]
MAKRKPSDPYNIRAQVDPNVEAALRRKQGLIQIEKGTRPNMDEVVAVALKEWQEAQVAA